MRLIFSNKKKTKSYEDNLQKLFLTLKYCLEDLRTFIYKIPKKK